ncbi:MAG TPA: T9SS type A sorting domain-containing protein [Phnomibacter sp.]|nr:T9SS type A sorting domain-containing protein [Phnomibacter sp.]
MVTTLGTAHNVPECNITSNNIICEGGSATFTASGGTTYAWKGPGGFTANTATISNLTVPGTYTVTVSANGSSSTCSRELTVKPSPTCNITGSNIICTGASATFTASGGTAYSWTGPGGFTANTATISNLTVAGRYTVKISIECCEITCSKVLTVVPMPVCNITGDNVVCTGSSASFTATGGTSYAWTGPGGFTANTATISNLTVAGTYTVTVSSYGCVSTCSRELTFKPAPECNITGTNVICAGASASFTASGGTAYAWTGPGGFTANTATISNLTVAGTYTVTVSANGCERTCTRELTVNPLPECNITGNNVICAGASATFTASGGTAYAWTGPGGFTANTATISNLTMAGTYTVTVSANGCERTCTRELTVNPLPVCNITGNNEIPAGGSTTFTASGGTDYSWTGPDGFTANTATISNLTVPGTYTVTVRANGCVSTCSRELKIIVPVPFCDISGNNVICAGGSTTFTAIGGTSYAWTGPGGFTANTAIISNLTVAGTYTVTVSSDGISVSCNRVLTVNPLPVCTITGNNSIYEGGSASFTATGGTSYAWTGPGGFTANTATISNLTVAGTYTVTVSANGCESTCSRTLTIKPALGQICTYTQGYYGNAGGRSCDGTSGGNSTTDLINKAIAAWNGNIEIGAGNNVVTISTGQANCVIEHLPGGGASRELSGSYSICALPGSYLRNGNINNTLLAQTITLGLNLGIGTALGDLVLQAGTLVTEKAMDCGSSQPQPGCTYEYYQIPANVVNALGNGKTVADLYILANNALGNVDGIVGSENGISLSAIASLVDLINNAFDECRLFAGWDLTPCVGQNATTASLNATSAVLNVTASPNPFRNDVKFTIRSQVSGQAELQIFNMQGQTLQTMDIGFIIAGKAQVYESRIPSSKNGMVFYKLRVGDKEATGKILQTDQR